MSKILTYNGKYLNISGQLAVYDNISDLDGNQYTSVKIGNQIWLGQNLKTTKYSDGSSINNITGNAAWASDTVGAYCWYNNDYATYGTDYGALYNWHAVNHDASVPGASLVWLGRDGIRDTNWRIPSQTDWNTFITYVGSNSSPAIKESGTTYWSSDNGTNLYGFSGRGNGSRDLMGSFSSIKVSATIWSTSETTSILANYVFFSHNTTAVSLLENNKASGYAVRCVKDG